MKRIQAIKDEHTKRLGARKESSDNLTLLEVYGRCMNVGQNNGDLCLIYTLCVANDLCNCTRTSRDDAFHQAVPSCGVKRGVMLAWKVERLRSVLYTRLEALR